MPAYLVHGVPDTSRLWDAVRAQLARQDVIAPDLPGFGRPIPAGFDCSADTYAAWLVDDIAHLGTPVDLVGHDWGSLLAQRVAALRPDLIRTLACGNGPIDREYQWHDTAVAWQTPGLGEQLMDLFAGEPAITGLVASGLRPDYAADTVARVDAVMKDAILKLYRSAVDIGARWEPSLENVRCPTLVIWAVDDPFVDARFGERAASRLGAHLVRLDGGHHWPVARAAEVARALTEFWHAPRI